MDVSLFWNMLSRNLIFHQTIRESRIQNTFADLEAEVINASASIKREQLASFLRFSESFTDSFRPYIFFLVKKMEECTFYKYPSVTKSFNTHLASLSTQYDLLKNIDLESHTLNVAYKTALYSRNLPDRIKSINLIIALLHDFGKCDVIEGELACSEQKHWKLSAEFAKRTMIMFDIPEGVRTKIIKVLYYHHDQSQDVKNSEDVAKVMGGEWFEHLRQADESARADEIAALVKGVRV